MPAQNKIKIGKIGEKLAEDFLISKNYEILKNNFHSKYGEIDIIAKKDDEYVFVEVKTRDLSKNQLISGVESIISSKKSKIQKTIYEYFFSISLEYEVPWRCDVIIIEKHKTKYRIIHYPSAF